MICIQFECNVEKCEEDEYVDVYRRDWDSGTPIDMYLPEGWSVVGSGADGSPIVKCPAHR
jgi:hypothetical protein